MVYFVVGTAGVLGALTRYAVGLLVSHWLGSEFPWGTLLINWTGCLTLGWFLAIAASHPKLHPYWRVGFATGFIGSFTTFSTFSVDTLSLLKEAQFGAAVGYILASMWGGLFLAWLGNRLAGSGTLAHRELGKGER